MAQSNIIRPLSNLEVYNSAAHVTRQICTTVVSCRYALPEHVTLSDARNVLHRAVGLTVLEHPLMQVGMGNEDSKRPHWLQLKTLDLANHVTWCKVEAEDYESRLSKDIQEELHTWFDKAETQPGWRLRILHTGDARHLDVVLCWHHAHFDGMGAKVFHRTLLKHLNSPEAQKEHSWLVGDVIQLPDIKDRFTPSPEQLRSIKVTIPFTLKVIWKELFPQFLIPRNPAAAHWAPIRATPLETEQRLIWLNSATVANILKKCRAHKTTLTGIINALPVFSLAVQLEGRAKALSSCIAIDMRRFMPVKPKDYPWHVPDDSMDNEVTLEFYKFKKAIVREIQSKSSDKNSMARLEDTMWSLAAVTREKLQAKLDSDLKNDAYGLMDYVSDWRKQWTDCLSKPRPYGWGVTNLGAMDGGDGDWKIESARFQLGTEVVAAAFAISIVSVKGGDLCIQVAWQEGIIDNALGDKLAEDMEAWLHFIGEPEGEKN